MLRFDYKYCVLKYFDFRGPLIHVVKNNTSTFSLKFTDAKAFLDIATSKLWTILLTWSFLFTFLTLFGHYWFIIRVYFTFVNKMWWKNCFSDTFSFEFIYFFGILTSFSTKFGLFSCFLTLIRQFLISCSSFLIVSNLFWLILNHFHANL